MKKLLSVLLAILCVMNLTVVSFAAEETGTCGENVIWTLDESTGTLTISGDGEIDSSELIGRWRLMNIRNVVIEEGVTSIGNNAFQGIIDIESVTIPDSITSIGKNAFYNCDNLKNVVIGDGVISIGDGAFMDCIGLENIVWGNSVKVIGKQAFFKCESIETLTIPDTVTSIGESAFALCKKLVSVSIPDSVTRIEMGTFILCENLAHVSIPDSVTSIGKNAFGQCYMLESVILSSNLEYIGNNALHSTTIYYEGSEEQWNQLCLDSGSNVIAYEIFYNYGQTKGQCGENAFWSFDEETGELIITGTGSMTDYSSSMIPWYNFVSDIKKVTIENGITSISEAAFANCTSLTEITIPGSVTTFDKEAFKNCSNIVDIYYTGTVAEWCNIDFNYDYYSNPKVYGENLYVNGILIEGELVIPDGVTTIKDYAFWNCDNITGVILPDSITSIGKNVFGACDNLTSAVYNGTEEQWSNVSVDTSNNKLITLLTFSQPETPDTPDVPDTPVTPDTPDEPAEPTIGEKIVDFLEKIGDFFVSIYEWFVNLFKF